MARAHDRRPGGAPPSPSSPRARRDGELPRVVSGDATELAQLALARHVDGHAPGLRRLQLNAYAAAGIQSDHEASTADEGRERLRAGLWLLVREASAARNLRALVPLALEYGPSRRASCTDDRKPEHIANDGHMNALVRDAVALGIPSEDALVMATLSPALYLGLDHLGAIAPGYHVDVLLLPDWLRDFGGGIVVADEREVCAELPLPVAGLLSDRTLTEELDASRAIQLHREGTRGSRSRRRSRCWRSSPLGDPVAQDHRSVPRRRRPP